MVIPNYNGSILLPIILPCLYEALNNTKLSYEVILVDDCSTDDSIKIIKNNFTTIILLENKVNSGFSKTINKGIFVAQYDYVLLLNSDVKLTPNYFETLLPYFDDADTFGVMGRIIGWDNDTIQDGGKYPTMQGVKIKTSTNYIPLQPKENDRLYSMYLSGANAFVCRKKLLGLNGFDEIFSPFYVEDVDLSLRAWRMGWKCYYEHDAVCRHQTSVTIKSTKSKNEIRKIYYRNKMFLHAIHLQKLDLLLWHLQLILEAVIHLVTGRFWYFKSLQYFINRKKEIQQSKKIFTELQGKNNKSLSVNAVFFNIKNSLKKLKINKF